MPTTRRMINSACAIRRYDIDGSTITQIFETITKAAKTADPLADPAQAILCIDVDYDYQGGSRVELTVTTSRQETEAEAQARVDRQQMAANEDRAKKAQARRDRLNKERAEYERLRLKFEKKSK